MAEDEAGRVTRSRSGVRQLRRDGARRLFQGRLREEFLEWFAATANVKWAAEKAGIAYQTVWKHRMKDPGFAADFDRALDQALVRVKAKLLETRIAPEPAAIGGGRDAPELDAVDADLALRLIAAHERGRTGVPKQVHRRQVASNGEVRAALAKRLAALGARVTAGDAAAPSPAPDNDTAPPAEAA